MSTVALQDQAEGEGRLAEFWNAPLATKVFWLLQIVFVFKGVNAIRAFETWTAPLKVLVCVGLVWWAVSLLLGPVATLLIVVLPKG